MKHQAFLPLWTWLALTCFPWWCLCASASEWYVAPNGTYEGRGTQGSPWDLGATLRARHPVRPGDTVWIQSGSYKHSRRNNGAMGFEVYLAGTQTKPITIRALPYQRATIDGGLMFLEPSAHLYVRDLEILVSENFTQPRRLEETGSHPASYNRPWGGLNIYGATNCHFINLVLHDNAQGVSWWADSHNSELYGCLIYNNGWEAPDRGHGHAIYTQNNEGIKTISDCILCGGNGYSLHAYGSKRADINNYFVTGNCCYNSGEFLIGGDKPSQHIRVLTNYLYNTSMRLGYEAPYNEDCEVLGNLIVNGSLAINKFKQVVNQGNRIYAKNAAHPSGLEVILRPNRYDNARANLMILNWERRSTCPVQLSPFLRRNDRYRILKPEDFYGRPLLTGTYEGKAIEVPLIGECGVFIVLKMAP